MEKIEVPPQSRINNSEFIQKFIDVYATELEKMVTEPTGEIWTEKELDQVNNFRTVQKLPRAHRTFRDLLVRVGQDFRLTVDEIEILRNKFLE